ncbi:hypothetical protein NF699_14210 [Sphingomonadaceae bacterium OTU29LAMAA1]|nr:hypothetical protein NF699_14210 [Sphingomonadaceae bacterium OTU29LAMAA1]
MSTSLSAKFDTRREAEMTVERLVQQFSIERTDIFIAPEGSDNTAGVEEAGSDTEAGTPTPEDRDDAALAGRVVVSVDIEDYSIADEVRAAFEEFHAEDVNEL